VPPDYYELTSVFALLSNSEHGVSPHSALAILVKEGLIEVLPGQGSPVILRRNRPVSAVSDDLGQQLVLPASTVSSPPAEATCSARMSV
jgi:hypothetical protein